MSIVDEGLMAGKEKTISRYQIDRLTAKSMWLPAFERNSRGLSSFNSVAYSTSDGTFDACMKDEMTILEPEA